MTPSTVACAVAIRCPISTPFPLPMTRNGTRGRVVLRLARTSCPEAGRRLAQGTPSRRPMRRLGGNIPGLLCVVGGERADGYFSIGAARILARAVPFEGVCVLPMDPATLVPT